MNYQPTISRADATQADPEYQTGFGNYGESEAVPGALPVGQNSPQRVPFGLFAEQLSGSAFTAPRHLNKRSWLYRIRPAADHGPFTPYEGSPEFRSAPFGDVPPSPNRMRWDPLPLPTEAVDFVDGIVTLGDTGDVAAGDGVGIHLFAANRSMEERAFFSADGELLIVLQMGKIRIDTEFGSIELEPQQIAVVPRGVRFRVMLDEPARGYICENYGAPFQLPDLGPIGANGLANPRDFETPVAAFEERDQTTELIQKFQGSLWSTMLDHSPFDVVAWHGNLAPYRYDLRRFNTINTVSFDHPDPSIFTVLTSPSNTPGTANCDFVIFPPRWTVAENTFRPPWFHRNVMSEFMGLIQGEYDAKAGGFSPGGASLHNQMNGHGPDQASYEKAVAAQLVPQKIENTMAFMFETRHVVRLTSWAAHSPTMQLDYDQVWSGFSKAQLPR